ncbi:GSCOCG00006968001-RA-CDS [Cotesia congregata]|nr:GSCOCG00006968001-RA-CDS [Cotesia congregata]
MSEIKYIARPKVRFSETSESADDSASSSRATSSRLRIRSIENVKKPFKLVREVRDSFNLKSAGESVKTSAGQVKPKVKLNQPIDLAGESKNNSTSSKIESNKENITTDKQTKNGAVKKSLGGLSVKKSSDHSKEMEKITKILDSVSIKNPRELKPTKVSNLPKKAVKNSETKIAKPNLSNLNQKVGSSQSKILGNPLKAPKNQLKPLGQQFKAPGPYKPSITSAKTPAVPAKSSGIQSKAPKVSTLPKLQSKSVAQIRKPSAQAPKPQIKVTTARNKSIARPNVYVGPGVLKTHVTRSLPAVSGPKPDISAINSTASAKLHRPEYNSIVNTIKRIDKSKNEKIVTDFEHLPHPYKNLVVRKMSSALDFPADKPIFKDLIDLSVDESHLPERITRTKDPQPRERDLEPKLEDFFKPVYGEEYCTSVKIRPRTPEFDDNLSAFKISDRIFDWKSSLDE